MEAIPAIVVVTPHPIDIFKLALQLAIDYINLQRNTNWLSVRWDDANCNWTIMGSHNCEFIEVEFGAPYNAFTMRALLPKSVDAEMTPFCPRESADLTIHRALRMLLRVLQ